MQINVRMWGEREALINENGDKCKMKIAEKMQKNA